MSHLDERYFDKLRMMVALWFQGLLNQHEFEGEVDGS